MTHHTIVFKGDPTRNFFGEDFCGMDPRAWSKGRALQEKDKLEDFIRRLSFGEIDDPKKEANLLMDKMRWK